MNNWNPFMSNSSGELIPKPYVTEMPTIIKNTDGRLTFKEILERKFGMKLSEAEPLNEDDEIGDDETLETPNVDDDDNVTESPEFASKAERAVIELITEKRPCVYNPVVIDSRVFMHVRLIEEKIARTGWANKMRYIRPAQYVLTGIVFIPREITADGAVV